MFGNEVLLQGYVDGLRETCTSCYDWQAQNTKTDGHYM